VFQISLPTLLETLQILGTVEATRPKDDYNAMRTNARLRTGPFSPFWGDVTGMCLIDWDEPGSPLIIRLEEAGLRTSIDMNTYESEMPDDIPFDHDHVAFRIIMQARLLNGIMAELATTGPEKLTIGVSRDAPYVTFSGHSDLGDTVVDLARGRRDLLETFYIPPDADEDNVGWLQTYRYDLLRLATDAMRIASKVAFRGDAQGVVSWNFMIDRVSELGKNSFVRFDYVPYARGIDDGDDEAEEDDDDGSPGRDRDDIGF
jgi:cell cycle checkpoint protein